MGGADIQPRCVKEKQKRRGHHFYKIIAPTLDTTPSYVKLANKKVWRDSTSAASVKDVCVTDDGINVT